MTWDQLSLSTGALDKETLSQTLGQNMQAPNRILASPGNYGNIAVGFPQLMVSHLHEDICYKLDIFKEGRFTQCTSTAFQKGPLNEHKQIKDVQF